MQSKSNLIWLDLEMTGLVAANDVILEIATIATDGNLTVLEHGPSLVINQSEVMLAAMDAWVLEHHTKSGLLNEVRQSTVFLEQAEQETLNFIKKYCEQRKGILCGNSIWQDRSFLAVHMPSIDQYLNYRMIDVTSVKELAKRWYHASPHLSFKKTDQHRAMADVVESIEELRHYQKYFFVGK